MREGSDLPESEGWNSEARPAGTGVEAVMGTNATLLRSNRDRDEC